MNYKADKLVYTDSNCVGCNKCVLACSCVGACVSEPKEDMNGFRIKVDPNRCIACGACFDVCMHGARHYYDDTDKFFDDLKRGEEISVLIAPSFKANYPEQYEKVLGGLKERGVKRFISVSFGADIATWGCINYIKNNNFVGGISQPCPAVVNYIEKYRPELLPMLMPIQSPLICAAIYARKKMNIKGKFAFISPCIAKKIEIEDPNTKGYVSYNVTFDHLMKYVEENNVYGEPLTDEVEYGLGAYYPAPGGLKDYVRWLLGPETLIRAISGEKDLYKYLDANADAIIKKETPFLFFDALNCKDGCICGTAVETEASCSDKALVNLLKIKESVKNDRKESAFSRILTPDERLKAFNEQFKDLNLNDFIRKYSNKSYACDVMEPTDVERQGIFMEMHKYTEESKNINCSYCGYESCKEMATAIYNGFNRKENCVYYLRSMVEDEQELLKYRAEHDEILDIWNRRAAMEQLKKLIDEKEIDKYSIIMADIDDFKGINETYGTNTADQLLVKLTFELKQYCISRKYILSRYGGDEFLIIIPGEHLDNDSPILEALKYVVGAPISIGGDMVTITVTMGVSNSDDITPPEGLVMEAEVAMNEAKSRGRGVVFIYAEELKQQAREEAAIKDKLTDAFDNDGFFMVYQPQVNSKTKKVCGFEALVRMKQPGIYPGQFIPVAEKNGWIWRIGRITTKLVIKQLAAWRDEGRELHPVSVNFSSNQLNDKEYVEFLENLLRQYNIPARYVEIEITESLFLDRTAQADVFFKKFKDMGIRLLMDDFGTGYSSLGYLTYIPVDVIKLDKSLVDTYLVDGKDVFIKDVIKLMHDLDKEMIIEGVEEKRQFERLREFDADVIQGYYFSKPLPPAEAIEFSADDK